MIGSNAAAGRAEIGSGGLPNPSYNHGRAWRLSRAISRRIATKRRVARDTIITNYAVYFFSARRSSSM